MSAKQQLTEILEQFGAQLLRSLAQNPIAVITEITGGTISCKPVINRVVNDVEVELPEFVEVPPVFLYGGANYDAHPLEVGDYCILVVSERCIDAWYEGQDFKPPAEFRAHDYSDAFALVGIKNRKGALEIPTDGRTWHIGDRYFEGDHEHVGREDVTGDRVQTGEVELSGNHEAGSYSVGGTPGWNGTFATGDSRVATVVHGLITKVE